MYVTCGSCNGSGEGMVSYYGCSECGGSGEVWEDDEEIDEDIAEDDEAED